MNSSRTPNESALSEETDQPEKKFLPEIKRQVESTWIVDSVLFTIVQAIHNSSA